METPTNDTVSASDRSTLIALWQESGKSKRSFCREFGLKYHKFISWTNPGRIRKKASRSFKGGSFVPVRVHESPGVVFAELSFSNGAVVLFRQPVAAGYLRKLVR
jgi:hypothetical protein